MLNNDPLLSKVRYLERFDALSGEIYAGKICKGRLFFEELENDDLNSLTNKIVYICKNILKQYDTPISDNIDEIKEDLADFFHAIKQKGNYDIFYDLKDLAPAAYHRIFSMKCFTSKK